MKRLYWLTLVCIIIVSGCRRQYPELERESIHELHFQFNTGQAYGLFSVPAIYETGEPLPLIVALHGYGSAAEPFHEYFKPAVHGRGYVLLTPQGMEQVAGTPGHGWDINAEESIRLAVDAIQSTVNIDRFRIYLLGFSQGGRLAAEMGFKYPQVFAGIAALGCGFDEAINVSGSKRQYVYIGVGELEQNSEQLTRAQQYLNSNGHVVHIQVFPGTGHALPQPPEEEINRIIDFFENKR